MLIHVEANQFFPDSNYPRCSGQPVLRFKLFKTIERRGLLYGERSSPHSRRSLNVTKLVLHIPIPLSLLLLLFFFSRVAACNQPKFRESILDALTHPPMHPSLATGPFDFRNFRLIVFEALLPGSRGHFHFLAPEIFHFHRRPRLGGNRDGGGGLSTLFPEGLELVRWIWFEFRGNCDRMIIR